MIFKNNKTYDILKGIALHVLPAIGTLYFALSKIWGLPYGGEITGTITAIETFLGALLGISSYKYNNLEEETDYTEDDLLLTERDDE